MRSTRSLVRVVVLGTLVMLASGCRSRPKESSAEYEQARTRFSTLYAEKLDEAYTDPRIEEIQALLEKVPADSADAEAAGELQQRIEDGQAEAEEARAAVKRAIDEATAASDDFEPAGDAEPRDPAPDTVVQPEEPVDAGPAGYPTVGMSSTELARRFGTCFRPGTAVDVAGRGLRETWVLKDITLCAQQFPAFTDSTLVIEAGKVLATVPSKDITTEDVVRDAGPAPAKPVGDAGSP